MTGPAKQPGSDNARRTGLLRRLLLANEAEQAAHQGTKKPRAKPGLLSC
jgi:hypothetical protein